MDAEAISKTLYIARWCADDEEGEEIAAGKILMKIARR